MAQVHAIRVGIRAWPALSENSLTRAGFSRRGAIHRALPPIVPPNPPVVLPPSPPMYPFDGGCRMRDDAGAPPVTPVGSRLGITPASTGGLATPPAPDHHVPAARSAAAPRADRLCAAHLAPGPDRPSDEPPRPPEQDRPSAASWAPDQHVPAAPTATAPGVDRLRAAHLAPGPDRPSDEPPRPPEQDRPSAPPRGHRISTYPRPLEHGHGAGC